MYICSVNNGFGITRGLKSPLFILKMLRQQVQELLDEALNERSDLFLIDLEVKADNSIHVIIDGDKGVLVEDCMFISRAIEHNLDREEQDFSLTVTSAGAASPLVLPRQYKKNMGRDIEIITSDSKKVSGKLENISEDSVVLKWKTREPKPVGKGKTTVIKEETISFDNIKEAKVIIKF